MVFSPAVVVQGNLIGVGSDGLTRLGNGAAGIITFYDTLIGGTVAAARNVISTNGGSGIVLDAGTGMAVIEGNYIGTDASGLLPRGNASFGILANIAGNTIGGAEAWAPGNVIAANGTRGDIADGNGLLPGGISSASSGGPAGNLIEGNLIGASGPTASRAPDRQSRQRRGSRCGATNNTVLRNTIAYNAADTAVRGAGIEVIGSGSVGNVIDANSIFANNGLGIDLGNDGVTQNTPGGPHVGPNDLQNFPGSDLGRPRPPTATTVVVGTLNGASTPYSAFTDSVLQRPRRRPLRPRPGPDLPRRADRQ